MADVIPDLMSAFGTKHDRAGRSDRFPPDDIARLRRRASQEPGRSMRHEYRDGHSSQHAAGDTAEHELAQTRVAVAAHHNEIDVLVSRM